MRTLPMAFLVALSVAGCKNKDATASGASVLAWDTGKSTRASFAKVVVGARRAKDVTLVAHPFEGAAIKLRAHVETADVTFEEDGKPQKFDAPVSIAVTVDDANDFTLGGGKCDGPDFQLAAPGAAPKEMIVQCRIKATKPNADVGVSFEVWGDGKVTAAAGDKVDIADAK